MSETVQTLDKDKILSTQSRRLLFDGLMQGLTVAQAAEKAKLGAKYAGNIVEKCGINALVRQEQVKISERTGITIEWAQSRLVQEIESASNEGKRSAVMQGLATLLKSIGGMTGDRPHPDALAAKHRDNKHLEALRKLAAIHYNELYLAVTGTDSSMSAQFEAETEAKAGVNEPQSEPQPATEARSEDRAENFSEAPPMPPQAPAAESPTLSVLHETSFENGGDCLG